MTNRLLDKKNPKAPDDRGFTLLELAVVLFMMTILATVAIIKFSANESSAVRSAAHRIVSDIGYCQEIAKMSNKGTMIEFVQSSGGGGGGLCFVATACYGESSPYTVALRGFRDKVLCRSEAGRLFIEWYYDQGPTLAQVVANVPAFAQTARILILPLAIAAMPFTGDVFAFGGGGGGGTSGDPNTYTLKYQDGSAFPNPQGSGPYVVVLGDRARITSGNRTIRFDSVGGLSVDNYNWSDTQKDIMILSLNSGAVRISIARHTGKAWVY